MFSRIENAYLRYRGSLLPSISVLIYCHLAYFGGAALILSLNPVLMAATNSSGGVMGKMISPQNISTGVATTDLKGKEGVVFAKTFKHSILLTVLLGILVWLQQNVLQGMIPH